MHLELFQDAILTTDVPNHDLRAGDVGTVVDRHVAPGQEDGYSVEFFDMSGHTIAVLTLPAHMLRQPAAGEVPSVRLRRTG